MTKTVTVQARMEPQLKRKADEILEALGINASTAITLFYTQMVRDRGIPLELKMPNKKTLAAMRELKNPAYRKKTKKFDSVDDLMAELEARRRTTELRAKFEFAALSKVNNDPDLFQAASDIYQRNAA